MSSHHNSKHALSTREQRVTNTGLAASESKAYQACIHLSCANETCIKKWMYRNDAIGQRKECGPLFKKWEECFATKKAHAMQQQQQQQQQQHST